MTGGTKTQSKITDNRITKTAAQEAFFICGLTYEQVARRVDVTPRYLRRLLRTGADCYVTADRLRRVLGCPVEFFLPRPKEVDDQKSSNRKINRKGGGPPGIHAERSNQSMRMR